MSVIAELRVAAGEFELGRILRSVDPLEIELERMVPLGRRPIPFVLVHDGGSEALETSLAGAPGVGAVREVDRYDGTVLYTLDWDASRDRLLGAMDAVGAQLLSGRGAGTAWTFEVRFPSHAALSAFNDRCADAGIDITADRVYDPRKPAEEPWFGLTGPQRETLVRAVEGGYYDIPRRMSTADLAEEFDVSDQAITERLRRAIVALAEHTLLVPDAAPGDGDEHEP